MTYALAAFIYHRFRKKTQINEIWRTQQEQDSYYANNPDYNKSPWLSVHQEWRGEDIDTDSLLGTELVEIQIFLEHFRYLNPHKPQIKSYLVHDIGLGKHLHLQVDSSHYTEILDTI